MALETNTNRTAANPGESAATSASINIGPSNRPTITTELLRAEAGDVNANEIAMERSGAESVSAQRVIMNNSGARSVDARSAQIDRSGILGVRSEKAVLYHSTAVGVVTEEARIVRGNVFALKANQATIEGDVRIAIYAGPPGAVTALLDARSAAVFGAALGVVLVTLGAILRRLARRA